jgi:hypothetical protein
MAHSRITGVLSTDFFVAADAVPERTAEAEANIAPAPINVLLKSLLFITALP